MSNIIKFSEVDQLPAHLKHLAQDDEWGSGQLSGFPVLSLKGKVFHIVKGDDKELVTRPDDPDEAATSLGLVIIRTNAGVARTYYATNYEEGSNEAPDCYSNDGVRPAPDAEDPQSKQCATCPHSQWGSRITENGKKGKACSEVKRLAVAEPGDEENPMMLRVPPTSLKNWDEYVRKLGKKGANPSMVVTRIGFDHSVSHQLLTFKPVGFITDEMAEAVADVRDSETVKAIIGQGPAIAQEPESDDGQDHDEDEPAPRRRKAAPKDEEEEEPAPRRRRKAEEPEEDEPAPRRRKAAPKDVEEEEEPAPRRRRRKVVDDEDEAPAKTTKSTRKSEPEPDEEEDEAEKPKSSGKKTTTVVEEGDDLEEELNGLLDELDFDD